jgi:hypothetical protein
MAGTILVGQAFGRSHHHAGRNLEIAPIPLSNVPPALATMLLAFTDLEEDGMLLCVALVIIIVLPLITVAATWQAMSMAGWVTGPF